MKIISHRGNLTGPDKKRENNIDCIIECIEKFSIDVEIDLHVKKNKIYLTHDEIFSSKTRITSFDDFKKYKNKLWIHCKNIEALIYANENLSQFNYFGHTNDPFVLTSKKYIFTLPSLLTGDKVIWVMPELINACNKVKNVYAVLTDYPLKFL